MSEYIFESYKDKLKIISKYANILLLFCIIVDPTNVLFGIKDISFVFFVLVSLPFADFKWWVIPLSFLTVFFLTFAYALLRSFSIDVLFALGFAKSFLFLIYVFWVDCDYLRTAKTFYYITLFLSMSVLVIYFLMLLIPKSYAIISYFSEYHDNYFVQLGVRNFYGIDLFVLYHRVSSVCVVSLAMSMYLFLSTKRVTFLFNLVVFAVFLFISGTRANMLSCILVVLGIFLFYLLLDKNRVVLFVGLSEIVSITTLVAVLFLLLAKDNSTEIKSGHLQSFIDLFLRNPVRFFFTGFGPGAYMYSEGFQEVISLTELSYLELIKNFGLLMTTLLVMMFGIPLLKNLTNVKNSKLGRFALGLSYLAYLFIAGTNPLLTTSTGLIVYVISLYLSTKNIENEFFERAN